MFHNSRIRAVQNYSVFAGRAGLIFLSLLGAMLWVHVFTANLAAQTIVATPEVEESEKGVLKKKPEIKPLHVQILEYRKIKPDVESIREFLESLQPDHPAQKELAERARKFINNLSDESYRIRRLAREELGKMTTLPIEQLKQARSSNDPEVRASAAMLLAYSKKQAPRDSRDGITGAVCKTIVEKELKGLVDELNKTLTLFQDDEKTIHLLRKAIVVSAIDKDVELLKQMVSDKDRQVRIIGVQGIVQVQGEASVPLLTELLADDDEHLQVAAAREMANLGSRDAVETLIELMNSEELEVRAFSNKTLRALFDKNFKFYAFENVENRKLAIERWQEFVDADGATAEIHFPLVDKKLLLGRILLSDYSSNKVVEIDMEGNTLWEQTIANPWAVQGLPNGHRLVGQYSASAIVEYNAEGDEVGKIEGIPGSVMGFCRIENGSTFVAASDSGKIIEYDVEGKSVWEADVGGRPTDVKALENGNMMVALMDQGQIVEFDRQGERVREITTEASPMQLQVTERGTFIVSHSGQNHAIEYDREGQEVRRIELEKVVASAREMDNGDFVIATSDSVLRRNGDGETVWEFKGLSYCYNVSPF